MENHQYCYKYPRPSVTTDCVIFGYDEKVSSLSLLLIKRKSDPYKGCWAFPGGFLNMDEDAETGALRELKEETNMDPMFIKQLGAYTKVNRDPRDRVITIAYYAITQITEVKGGDDAAEARWFSLDEIPNLAFDHNDILNDAISELKANISRNTTEWNICPESSTLQKLQNLILKL